MEEDVIISVPPDVPTTLDSSSDGVPSNVEQKENSALSGASSLSLSTTSMKETGLSSRIPRLQHRISQESLTSETNLSPRTIPQISLAVTDDENGAGSIGLVPGRLKRHHSICVRRDKTHSTPRSSTSRTSSPPNEVVQTGISQTPVKRHKSFSGGERITNISRYKNIYPNKSFTQNTRYSSSPSQIIKCTSRGNIFVDVRNEDTPSPNLSRFTSNDTLSVEHTPSPGCLSRRNTYHSLVVPETPDTPSPINHKRRNSYTAEIQDDILINKPTVKTAAVFDPGRVQVFVRVRPPNESEDVTKFPLAVSVPDEEETQLKLFDGKNDRCYQFDGILHHSSTNKQVYKTVGEPLVYSALSGFNGILMCYGQTGTGKTYTLMSNDGMSVRIVYQCFKVLNKDKRHKYTVTCSYLQIYQEKIFDLLNETRTIELSLREHPKTGVYIENLTEYVVHSPKEVLDLLKVGKRRLVFAETKMNRASSRSHAICQLKILKERIGNDSRNNQASPPIYIQTPEHDEDDEFFDSHDQLGQTITESYQQMLTDDEDDEDILSNVPELEDGVTSVRGKLYICDLAGSERIKKTKASGERLQEAQHINSSLLELGNVIQALAEGKRSHVPFRNSTLTRLLQEGLSGNCKTRLVVCVAPTVRDVHETKCSLNFGSRAMKIQVMAHVNYEVDYKKLAEALAAKLENLEQEWNVQKQNYDKFIKQLKNEIDTRRSMSPMENLIVGVKTPPKHVQSLLVIELMTLQLFYNLQSNWPHQNKKNETGMPDLPFTPPNLDMMLQSMEGLLELLSDYLRDRIPFRSKNYSMSSGCSSVITSPDCIDQSVSSTYDVPSTLEPVARFLEHAQITSANAHSNIEKTNGDVTVEQSSKERLRRVINSLLQMKELVSKKAISSLKETFESSLKGSKDKLNSLEEIVNLLDGQRDLNNMESLDDIQSLENSLYYLLMDKALLCCMVLLKSQSNKLFDNYKISPGQMENCEPEIKSILEELSLERSARDKTQMELYSLRDDQLLSDEKLRDAELELKTVRELRDSLETKLHAVESKNSILEEQIEKYKEELEALESRIEGIEKRKLQLECSLKNSDNNNARKERSIVDLKNEKVALESLVSTLKEEITILEKERTRETDEKRRVEEELEDVRDRNIILETEWSCCREENGLLETELTALEEDKAILEDELSKYRDDVKMLEEAVNMLEAQASDYKQDIMSLKAKEERLLANVRVEKEKFNKEINGLKQEMSTLRLERRRFQRDISVSRTDKSNTERAYNALKTQKDSLQEDITSFKQEEKRLQREISTLKSDRCKLEREIHSLKNENTKLKQDIVQADKIKVELKLLQKNEDKIAAVFKIEKDRLYENLLTFKEKYERMEQDFTKVNNEKDKLSKQLKKYEQTIHEKNDANVVRRSQSQPSNSKSQTPEKGKMKQCSSVQGALVRRSVTSGEVSEVEGKVLDLQRRLAFFMAEKEDIQKELITTRERNTNLTSELKTLEADTSKIQLLLTKISDEKETLRSKLTRTSESKDILQKEQTELKKAVGEAQTITAQLRVQLDEVSEQNRVLEVDYITIKESAEMLQGERVVLSTENAHIKKEFQNMDNELKQTRNMVQEFNTKLTDLKEQVRVANEKESTLNEKVTFLETENMSLSEQVSLCQHEEEILIQQLADLNEKFNSLEISVENIVVERNSKENEVAIEEMMEDMRKLKEENSMLEETVCDLKSQLETVVMDAEYLKEEKEEIEKVLQNDDEIMKDRESGNEKSLAENIRHLWIQLQKVKSEKHKVQEKMETVEKQFVTLGQENETLSQSMQEKSMRLEKEKGIYQIHIDKLQQQIEELIKERLQLEAEMEFLKSQNDELRRGIAVLLEDNSKLESELDVVEEEFEKQEKELDSATEETKVLLRQLCAAETKNLNLCTVQSNHQEDMDEWKKQIEKLKKEKEDISQKHLESEKKQKTLQERLLMAELEISKLKSEHASVEGQRRLLVDDLDAADRERNLLKTELHGLARALSPLKKEVTEVIKKQENLKSEAESKPAADISSEVARIKDELSTFNAEKSQLQMEQCELEVKLKVVGLEKEDLRIKLRTLIQDLDEQSKSPTLENLSEIAEPIQIVSKLITEKQELELEEKILSDDLLDAHYNNNILNICLDNSTNELRCAQQQLCIATVDRLKLKDKTRNIEKSTLELNDIMKHTDQTSPMDLCGTPRKSGISPLQHEVSKLKLDIEQFEKSQENILYEIRTLNEQLNVAENNLVNVIHFKTVIEKNLRQYKERNNKLETHLRVIYNDLIEMESHMENSPSESAKVLLETLDLQKHFQSLEDDLRDTESRNTKLETRNRTLKEDAADLMERCATLQEEKTLNTGLALWSVINKK